MSSDKTKLKNTYFLCIHWCRKLTWDYSVKKKYIYIYLAIALQLPVIVFKRR